VPQIPTDILVAAPLIIFAAYTIFGISGFGSALISIPLLAHFLPLTTVVPLMVLLDFSAAFTTGMRFRGDVERAEVKRVVPAMVVGVLLLSKVPGEALVTVLGFFVAGYGAHRLLARGSPRRFPDVAAHPTGLLGGMLGALFGVGGPVYVVYFASRIHDTARLRATLSVVFSLSTGFRIALFIVSGLLLDWRLLAAALALFPLMWFGTRLGQRLHLRLSQVALARFVSVLLIASGASLVARGFGWH
jgi:uncharacterized protein